MIRMRPELFSAYVGTGQFVGPPTIAAMMSMRKSLSVGVSDNTSGAISSRANEATVSIPNPKLVPSGKQADTVTFVPPIEMPEFSLLDWYYEWKGVWFSRAVLTGSVLREDLRSLGLSFSVPLFFFEGTEDRNTPIEPAEQYFAELKAPSKEFVRFEGADHFFPMNHSRAFLRELLSRVRPLAVANP
jgi:pimeloyl-ACP methyl ester carboxylesterase